MQEIGKFDVKIEVIPNGLEKCMASMVNISLVFIDSMHFMDSSLHALVKTCLIMVPSIYRKNLVVNC